MKIKILKYERYKSGLIRVHSHNCINKIWKVNPNFEFHKWLSTQELFFPIISRKIEEREYDDKTGRRIK